MPAINIPPGVVKGATPQTNPGTWYDANLVRWHENASQPIGGWTTAFTGTPFSSDIRAISSWRDNNDQVWFAFGSDDKLYVAPDQNTPIDVTPAGYVGPSDDGTVGYGIGAYGAEAYGTPRSTPSDLYVRANQICLKNFGEQLLASSGSDGILYKWLPSTPNTPLANITASAETINEGFNVPSGITGFLITNERYVMTFGGQAGAGSPNNPRIVRWSDQEDYTSWTFANVATTAGYYELQTEGHIQTGCKVQDGILVLTDNEVFFGQYEGPPYIYGFTQLSGNLRLLSPNTLVSVAGRAYWMGQNAFYMYQNGQVTTLDCPISDVFSTLDKTYSVLYSHAGLNGVFPEIWFSVCTNGSKKPNRTLIYNYQMNVWSIWHGGRTAICSAGVHPYPIMAGYDGAGNGPYLFQHEDGWLDNGAPRAANHQVWLESSVAPTDTAVLVRRVGSDSGQGFSATQVAVYYKDTNDSVESMSQYWPAQSSGVTPVRAGGHKVRIRVEATQDAFWQYGVFDVQSVPAGGRFSI